MTYETFLHEVEDSILTITLCRPDHLNAFTVKMAEELVDMFDRASADDEIGAVIVTGRGRAFCAGMDLTTEGNVFGLDESLAPTPDDLRVHLFDEPFESGVRDSGGKVALAIFRCTKPVIAAINGPAVGIGATMTLPMDIRLASDQARIGFVFARIGLTPEACSTWFLPRVVGTSQALEWLYCADILTASEAFGGGLLREVVPPERLMPRARELAARFINGRSRVSTALIRQMIYRNSASDHPLQAHRAESLAMFWTSIGSGKEGVAAFLEKRDARFVESVSSDLPHVFLEQSR